MRAIAEAQKLIGQASLNPIITSALEAARLAAENDEVDDGADDTVDG